jgi:phosphoglycerate dehydrogenase-like enzyme
VNVLLAVHSPFEIWTIPLEFVARLTSVFPAHTFLHATDQAQATTMYREADVVFAGQITREQLATASRLRWLHSPAAGVGGMLFAEMRASDVVITNSRGMSADTIAEHVVAVTLAIFRRLPQAFRSQADRVWAQDAIGKEKNRLIAGASVLVVGLGAIGTAVAARMTLLGAQVTGIRRRASSDASADWAVAASDRLHELLPQADVVVIAAPHTRETRNLIGARELSLMSRDAVLVNVSRGQLIDEPALVEALRNKTISAAALDVFVDEPLPPESPFWTLPNVLITPHTSGFRPDHWEAAIALFAENLRRFDAGEPLLNVVDKEAGY